MGKIGSTILTFLLSIPVTAVGFMAIFGVPQFTPLNASPNGELVIRDPFEQNPWGARLGQQQQANTVDQNLAPQGFPQAGEPYPSRQSPFNQSNAPSWPGQTPPAAAPMPNLGTPTSEGNPFSNRFADSVPPAANAPLGANGMLTGINSAPISPNAELGNAAPHNPFENSLPINRNNTAETAAQLLTWQQASIRLSELGIEKFHLERGDVEGSFLFVCLYEPQSTPNVTHRFEAEGSDPLVAVNQVLTQVDGWLQEQYRRGNAHSAFRF